MFHPDIVLNNGRYPKALKTYNYYLDPVRFIFPHYLRWRAMEFAEAVIQQRHASLY